MSTAVVSSEVIVMNFMDVVMLVDHRAHSSPKLTRVAQLGANMKQNPILDGGANHAPDTLRLRYQHSAIAWGRVLPTQNFKP